MSGRRDRPVGRGWRGLALAGELVCHALAVEVLQGRHTAGVGERQLIAPGRPGEAVQGIRTVCSSMGSPCAARTAAICSGRTWCVKRSFAHLHLAGRVIRSADDGAPEGPPTWRSRAHPPCGPSRVAGGRPRPTHGSEDDPYRCSRGAHATRRPPSPPTCVFTSDVRITLLSGAACRQGALCPLTARPRHGCRPPRSHARPHRDAARAGTS